MLPSVSHTNGYIRDNDTGLLVPPSYKRASSIASTTAVNALMKSAIHADGYNQGYHLDRDPDTLFVQWPERGSGLDDLASLAIVDGNVANVGAAPVIAPLVSAMVRRQQDQAATAALSLSGRATPVRKAKEALLRFNDSPLGATQAVMKMVHDLRTYNRGAPIATVPIHYPSSEWTEYGMEVVPIPGTQLYYLQVNRARAGTPIPYLPSVFDLEPTGNPLWPYWYYTQVDGKQTWVLLHNTHILPLTPGITPMPGVGLSSVWICLGILAETILVVDARLEKIANTMTDGVVLFSGVTQDANQIKGAIESQRAENKQQGFVLNKGFTVIASPHPDGKVVQISFRQDTGVPFKEWREYTEDVIAAAFSEPLSALVTRGGVGYGAQAETTADNSSEMGIGAVLHWIATGLGAIYPRTQVAFARASDRAKKLKLESFKTFSEAIKNLPEGTLQVPEIRAMMQRDIVDIPEAGEDDVTTNAEPAEDVDEAGVNNQSSATSESAEELMANVVGALHLSAILQLEVLYQDEDVTITDADVDEAIQLAGERVDPDFADLLVAEPVDE